MKAIKRILVPVDYSSTSGVALETALVLAKSFDAAVEVLHTWTDAGYVDASIGADVNALIAKQAREEMQKFLEKLAPPSNIELTARVQHGIPWQVITTLSPDYDLIVMGTHGRTGFKRLVLGSVAARVVQHAECPVMTVREPGETSAARLQRPEGEQIIHAMFDDAAQIEKAFQALQAEGIPPEKITLVMTEDTHDRDFKALERTKAVQGATAGGLMAGTIGGILGGLTAFGSVVTGGIGLVVMGPALAFAAAGGLFGGLLGRTVPEDRALVLKAQLNEGKTLMAVHADDKNTADKIAKMIATAGGEPIEL